VDKVEKLSEKKDNTFGMATQHFEMTWHFEMTNLKRT
jgi:hypothetical protein